jgi:branched-chain amino acid transport system ATP-binding protein
MTTLLEIQGLEVNYDGVKALRGVSLKVEEGSVATIIGPNGAGKSTLLRSISRVKRPSAGRISFDGTDLLQREPHEISKLGIAHVPEGRRIFRALSVEANLEMGAYPVRHARRELDEGKEAAYAKFPILRERRRQLGKTLSGGEQQMLAIARALMSKPRLLMLDEPSLGLAPIITREVYSILRELRDAGMTILLVEQNARMALDLADHAFVIENGEIVLQGAAGQVQADPFVREVYLGLRRTQPAGQ